MRRGAKASVPYCTARIVDALASDAPPEYTLTLIVHGPREVPDGTGQLIPNRKLCPGLNANWLDAMGTSVPSAVVAETVTVYLIFLDEQLVTIPKMPTKVPAVAVGVLSSGVATAAQDPVPDPPDPAPGLSPKADAGIDISARHISASIPLNK